MSTEIEKLTFPKNDLLISPSNHIPNLFFIFQRILSSHSIHIPCAPSGLTLNKPQDLIALPGKIYIHICLQSISSPNVLIQELITVCNAIQ